MMPLILSAGPNSSRLASIYSEVANRLYQQLALGAESRKNIQIQPANTEASSACTPASQVNSEAVV
jgi:hypothetical protein